MRLTRQSVAAITLPKGKPYMITWDDALPGFGVRVNEGGSRVWVVQYRASGKSKRETLGRVDTVSLDDARRGAKEKLAKVQLGSDPHAEKAEARARATVIFGPIADRYLQHAKPRLKPRSFEEVERHLTRHWGPLRDLPIHKIQRATVAARLSEIAGENGPFASNRARASLSALFTWAMGDGLADSNPVIGTNKATEEVSRDHVIQDSELAAIWKACRDDDHGRIVRLLILTGQRRDEVGAMDEREINKIAKLWSIPKARTKNGRPHDVPLSDTALAVLNGTQRRENSTLVFGEGEGGFQGWSKAKAALDKRTVEVGTKVRPWRIHDIRRTVATRLGDLGTLPHVIEAILNHVSGHKAGVAGIYNRTTYSDEKRAALDRWAKHIAILTSSPAAVTAIA
jgi:integrase